jgi:hypothetical protein
VRRGEDYGGPRLRGLGAVRRLCRGFLRFKRRRPALRGVRAREGRAELRGGEQLPELRRGPVPDRVGPAGLRPVRAWEVPVPNGGDKLRGLRRRHLRGRYQLDDLRELRRGNLQGEHGRFFLHRVRRRHLLHRRRRIGASDLRKLQPRKLLPACGGFLCKLRRRPVSAEFGLIQLRPLQCGQVLFGGRDLLRQLRLRLVLSGGSVRLLNLRPRAVPGQHGRLGLRVLLCRHVLFSFG